VAGSAIQDCIIGSGAAAGVLALRLAEAGRSVVVLEEGLGELPAAGEERDLLLRDGGVTATRDGGLTLVQGRCLGGSATVGHGVCEPLDVEQLGRWQDEHGWSPAGDTREASRRAMAWLAASPLPDDGHNRNNTLLLEGARSLGLQTRNLSLASGTGAPAAVGTLGGPLAGVMDAARLAGADFRARHRVARLGRSGDVVTEATGAGFGVTAERFFLCAGPLQGAGLLHASGLSPSGLGRNVSLVHRYLVVARFPDPVGCGMGAATSVEARHRDGGYLIEAASVDPPTLAAHTRLPLSDLGPLLRGFDRLAAAWCVVPGGTGDLSWSRKGRRWLTRSQSPELRGLALKAMVRAAHLFLLAGALEVVLPIEGVPPVVRRRDLEPLEELELRPGDAPALCLAPQGGCTAGDGGAVHADLRLRGTKNLYVCDASVFPSTPGPRAMVPVMTLGELLADSLT